MWGKRYPPAPGDCVADLFIALGAHARHEDVVHLPFQFDRAKKRSQTRSPSRSKSALHQPLRRL